MELKLRNQSGVTVVEIEGEIDLFHANKLKQLVNKLFENNVKRIIINMQEVTYIDSSGIGALLHIFSETKKRKLHIFFSNIHGSVKKVIELTKLTGYFPIVGDVEEAIQQLSGSTEG